MKTLVVLVVSLFMIGCNATVSSDAWEYAEEKCSSNDGVKLVVSESSLSGQYYTRCNNSAVFDYTWRTIKIIKEEDSK